MNNKHKRIPQLVYWIKDVGFEDLLQKDKSIKTHKRNLQILATEVFKSLNQFSLSILWDLFERKSVQKHNLCNNNLLKVTLTKTTQYST